VVFRWESAAPVMEALAILEIPKPPKTDTHYVVSITGMPMPMGGGPRGGQPGGEGRPPQQQGAMIKSRLLESVAIHPHDKQPIKPEDVDALRSEKGMTFRFYFPRANPIVETDKDVTIKVKMGQSEVQAKFGLKNMVYDGKLAL
jgi:hypothetical protein